MSTHGITPAELGQRIQQERRNRGWNPGTLADKANVARTTLYQLERGTIAHPRPSTLAKLAKAFSISLADLYKPVFLLSERHMLQAKTKSRGQIASEMNFDLATNPQIQEVLEQQPELFENWSQTDLQELASEFGTGGALTSQGVVQKAIQLNLKKQVLRKVAILMESHLRDVTAQLAEALFQMVCIPPA